MSGSPSSASGPIEDYLDELLVASRGHPRQVRSLLAEAEAHLHDAADAAQAEGLDRWEAERRAVAAFGPARPLVEADVAGQVVPLPRLVGDGFLSVLWLGSIGAIAVGASGVVAAVLGGLWGSRFLVTAPTSSDLTAASCARWLAHASTPSCARAALDDWTFETVGYRIALGVMGLIGFGLWVGLRRAAARRGLRGGLPALVVDTVGAVCFGVAGLWLAGMGVDALAVSSGHGAGQWLSAAPLSLALAGVFAWRLLGDLRTPGPPSAASLDWAG